MQDGRPTSPATINRRALIGGVTGAAALAVAVAGAGLVSAQTATPGATGSLETSTHETKLATRVTALISAVRADRDAVAAKIDATMVDRLLALASDLQGMAAPAAIPSSGAPSGDQTTAMRNLAASGLTAAAAREEIIAQLSGFGLPSQQAAVSELLAATFETITTEGAAIATTNNTQATSALTTAQDLYTAAHGAYGTKLYAQAARHDVAARRLVQVAKVLTGQGKLEMGNLDSLEQDASQDASSRMKLRERRRHRYSDSSTGSDGSVGGTPVAVPDPSF